MATLVVKDGELAGTTFPFDSEVVLGRVDADVTIGDPQISRRHLKISPGDGYVEVEDLGSTNGSWLNGERLHGRARLNPGDVLRVGETTLELEAPAMTAGGTVVGAAPDFEELKRQAGAEAGSSERAPAQGPAEVPPPPPPAIVSPGTEETAAASTGAEGRSPPAEAPPAFGDAPHIERHPPQETLPPGQEAPAPATTPWEQRSQRPAGEEPSPWNEPRDDSMEAPSPWTGPLEQTSGEQPPAWGQQQQPWAQGDPGTAPMPQATGAQQQQQQQGGHQSGGYAPPGGYQQAPQQGGYGTQPAATGAGKSNNKKLLLIAGGILAALAVGAAIFFFVLAANPLDTTSIESQLEEAPQLIPDLPFAEIDRVECPDDVEVGEGNEFQCTAFGPGGESATVDLVQEDDEGNVRVDN